MTRGYQGIVGPDGKSVVAPGLVDTSGGLDPEDIQLKEHVEKKLKQIFDDGVNAVKAQYKLEVAFVDDMSTRKPVRGMMSLWTNGGFGHGGGDEAVYFCPLPIDKNGVQVTCSTVLDLKWVHKEAAICPGCRRALNPKELTGQLFARLTIQNWAGLLARVWRRVNGDADIRRGFLRGKIRAAHDELLKAKTLAAADRLDEMREERAKGWAVYPLVNILKDTHAGADLEKRIVAFLSS